MTSGTLCLLITCSLLTKGEFLRVPRQAPPSQIFFPNGLQSHRSGSKTQFPAPLIPKFASFGGAPPQGFRTAPSVEEEDDEEEIIERNSIAPSTLSPGGPSSPPPQQLLHYRQQPSPSPSPQQQHQHHSHPPQQVLQFRPTSASPPILQQPIASAQVLQPQQALILKSRGPQQEQPQYRKPIQQLAKNQLPNQALSEEELEEKEEPDRLTELLPQSKFSCHGKKTGYYADDGLGCEVFHYCQDNARHSWICPEGFSFHQVHLICMPPSSDNICQQSSQFHFVNDFLYRPINADEVHARPNVSLRYADRYYPENYYETINEEENGERTFHTRQQEPPRQQQQQPIGQGSAPRPSRPTPQQFQQPTLRPLAQVPQHFTRQPIAYTGGAGNNQVYHSAEEVNIPLQSRRPTPAAGGGPTSAQRLPPQAQNNYDFENK